jgi:hypothetical protein
LTIIIFNCQFKSTSSINVAKFDITVQDFFENNDGRIFSKEQQRKNSKYFLTRFFPFLFTAKKLQKKGIIFFVKSKAHSGVKIKKGEFNILQLSAAAIFLANFEHYHMIQIKNNLLRIFTFFRIIPFSQSPKQNTVLPNFSSMT